MDQVTYYPGKTLPGEERRTFSLNYPELHDVIGEVCAGTLNVDLADDPDLGPPHITTAHYSLWRCSLATRGMIERDEPGILGYIIRVRGEDLPLHFLEILSPIHIRTALKKTNWPSFPIEVALETVLNSPKDPDSSVKLGSDAQKRVRYPSSGTDSA